ncbi:MAG: sigma factor, partial [Nocardioides sp.]
MTTEVFEAERPRLVALAARVLADGAEAEDVVQQAWLRWHGTDAQIDNLPAWLTTVTSRLCLDRLRVRRPVLVDDTSTLPEDPVGALDPADEVVLTGEVGVALALVLDRLSPQERVAF